LGYSGEDGGSGMNNSFALLPHCKSMAFIKRYFTAKDKVKRIDNFKEMEKDVIPFPESSSPTPPRLPAVGL
jgi:hypothetical protein